MFPIVWLPKTLRHSLNTAADSLLNPPQYRRVNFASPRGEPALVPPSSVSWRVFKNPVALFVGGVAAVMMELAEPSIRAGIWEHSSFRKDPIGRLRRTGLAAMTTVYGPRSVAESMIAGIVRMHAKVVGTTRGGVAYSASDAELLTWVHATAGYGFGQAYSRYVTPLTAEDFDRLYREAVPTAKLYGAANAPSSGNSMSDFFTAMAPRLEASSILFEFLQIMRAAPAFPESMRWMQPVLVRAAVDILPPWLRDRLGLGPSYGLRIYERPIARLAGALADRIVLPDSPASQACVRLGLPINHLYTSLSYRRCHAA
jgi:uncharacterized protein (DUF2236 family)